LSAVFFIRRFYGGLFSVKVAAVHRNAKQLLFMIPMEPDIPPASPERERPARLA
jgi:hypothetical protein